MFDQLGRLHPLLIHLPIGILIFALMITILPAKQREALSPALKLALILTAVSSFGASVAGYLLSRSGDYDADLVEKHQWLGIATTTFAMATLLMKPYKRQMVWVTVLVMTIASHMGGTITHGEGFLFAKSGGADQKTDSTDQAAAPGELEKAGQTSDSVNSTTGDSLSVSVNSPKQVFMYRDEVTPILKTKCYSCHSAVKKKGGLRLDGEGYITKGGKNGAILTKGNPGESILYTQLLLPLEDEKHMPPKGKKQLTRSEINLIHRWIAKGAPYGPIEMTAAKVASDGPFFPVDADANLDEGRRSNPSTAGQGDTEGQEETAGRRSTSSTAGQGDTEGQEEETGGRRESSNIAPANAASINGLKQQGIIIEPAISGSNGLTVNFVNVRKLEPAMLSSLNELKDQVVELKFTGQPLTDEHLGILSSFSHLNKLQLDKTTITDQGLGALQKFPALESLNLYGTSVTDAGIKDISSCKNLKRVYLWQTGVTEQGVKTLRAQRPGLKTDAGLSTLIKPDSTKKK
jgi:mono/diheme cytochrome c family protein/uncharacterized membrane protein